MRKRASNCWPFSCSEGLERELAYCIGTPFQRVIKTGHTGLIDATFKADMTTVTEDSGFLNWRLRKAGFSDDAKQIAGTDYAQWERIEQTFSNKGKPSRVLTPALRRTSRGLTPPGPQSRQEMLAER